MIEPILPQSKEMRFLEGDRRPVRASLATPILGTGADEARTFYVESFGCQMNDYDSEFIAERFLQEGYAPAPNPESADVLLFNTCAVREGAEERVQKRVQNMAGVKRRRPGMTIAVVGCMAQRLGGAIAAKPGLIDVVAGTDTYRDLPRLVAESRQRKTRAPLVATEPDPQHTYSMPRRSKLPGPTAFLTIMQGCDKFCTFCIVPYTRGRERSKPWADVVREASGLVQDGAKEIVLLGQNVNSYRDGDVEFAGLLRKVDAIPGIERIHFTSSYPRDMTANVFQAIAECKAPVEFLHFPVQSGSDRVLRRMKRRHTAEWYLERVQEARRIIAGVQFATDLIVGFPGETEEDFLATLRLVEEVRFAECYMYKYSPRAGTPAAKLTDEISEQEKSRRLQALIDAQRRIGREILLEQVGRSAQILIEGPSKRDSSELFGRTRNRFMVVVPQRSARPGDLVDVDLVELRGTTLRGIPRPGPGR
jgi:tRNA-2-methylthio-N6-dimethylallyladenosine synthase